MIDERPLGIMLAIAGMLGVAVAALADPLGIGEGEVFGWLQLTGVIVGGVVTLLGIAMSMAWVPYPGRTSRAPGAAAGAAPQTTIIEDSTGRRSENSAAPQTTIVEDSSERTENTTTR